jgi:hypothetical protein
MDRSPHLLLLPPVSLPP